MSECLTLVPKNSRQNYYCQEPVGSTSDRLQCVLKNISHVGTQNNIKALFISNTYERYITQECISLH